MYVLDVHQVILLAVNAKFKKNASQIRSQSLLRIYAVTVRSSELVSTSNQQSVLFFTS